MAWRKRENVTEWISVAETAALLGINPKTLLRLTKAGRMAHLHPWRPAGTHWRFSREAVLHPQQAVVTTITLLPQVLTLKRAMICPTCEVLYPSGSACPVCKRDSGVRLITWMRLQGQRSA